MPPNSFQLVSSSGNNSSMVSLLLICYCCCISMIIGVGGYFYFSEDKCDEITDREDCDDSKNCKWDPIDVMCLKRCKPNDNSSDCNAIDHCIWDSIDSVCKSYIPAPAPAPGPGPGPAPAPSGENLPTTSTFSCGDGLEIDPFNTDQCRIIPSSSESSAGSQKSQCEAITSVTECIDPCVWDTTKCTYTTPDPWSVDTYSCGDGLEIDPADSTTCRVCVGPCGSEAAAAAAAAVATAAAEAAAAANTEKAAYGFIYEGSTDPTATHTWVVTHNIDLNGTTFAYDLLKNGESSLSSGRRIYVNKAAGSSNTGHFAAGPVGTVWTIVRQNCTPIDGKCYEFDKFTVV
jgi:hypothetical protein